MFGKNAIEYVGRMAETLKEWVPRRRSDKYGSPLRLDDHPKPIVAAPVLRVVNGKTAKDAETCNLVAATKQKVSLRTLCHASSSYILKATKAARLLVPTVLSAILVSFASSEGQVEQGSSFHLVSTPDKQIAITVDDLPGAVPGTDDAAGNLHDVQRWNRGIVRALMKHHVPAIGFVIENKLQVSKERDARAAILEQWIGAGLELGNHTYSHVHFGQTTLQNFEDETLRGEVVTKALLSRAEKQEHYFRHPALNTGTTPTEQHEFEQFLRDHDYDIAPVTVENADFKFNDVLDAAVRDNNQGSAKELKVLYLQHTQSMLDFVESASRKLFGREIPQILLIHDNRINAELLDSLLTAMERRGYRFISLREALRDGVYESPDTSPRNFGRCYVCWDDRLQVIGQRSRYPWSSEPAWIRAKYEQIRKLKSP